MDPHDEYAAIDAVNWSTLKAMRESAMHYRHALEIPRTDNLALMQGRALHTLTFEPHLFSECFAIWEDGDRRGNAWQAFKIEHAGKTILKASEIDEVAMMADAVRRHPLVQPYFDGAEFETPQIWVDPTSDLRCKARTDWLVPKRRLLIDLKSTRSINGRILGREAARFGYHLQMAHYRNGVRHACDWMPQQVLIVAVEKTAPYDVGVFEVDSQTLDIAEVEVTDLLVQLAGHRASDTWPGRYSEIQALQLPAWVYDDDEDDIDGFGLSFGE